MNKFTFTLLIILSSLSQTLSKETQPTSTNPKVDLTLEKKLSTDQSLSSNFSGTLLGVLLFGLFQKNRTLGLKFGTSNLQQFNPYDQTPILQSLFNNECGPNNALISTFNFERSKNSVGLCYGGYIAILSRNPSYVRMISDGRVNQLYLNGFQKSVGRPNGVLKLQGDTRHFFNLNGVWFLNPDAEFNIIPY